MNNHGARVAIVDDDSSVRKAIARLLRTAELEILVCASAQEYLEQYDPDVPGCLVLDVNMPGIGGLELQDVLTTKGVVSPIIFLSGQATVHDSVQALKHGAVEFLTKPVDEDELLKAVFSAIEKDQLDRSMRAELDRIKKTVDMLTPREKQVFSYVVAGKLNKQIASELGTVEKTIKVHRARVMEKLQVRSLAELVMLAVKAGVAGHSPLGQ
ncbi:response regulator transcription factor [Tolumonas osonensis]|uniref:FixJ family two-component response regulator n=1 Tax=Tolumonas osonensis TaxID=675874 RepID=A0A841GIT0_9GAMM|nr:response regulator [Tolumonas osonensis]MBB6055121.1 FixJ family two-component response regulator [Tolumonas osonensis]